MGADDRREMGSDRGRGYRRLGDLIRFRILSTALLALQLTLEHTHFPHP
jgi:hypothetical protein